MPQPDKDLVELVKLVVSVIGLGGTLIAALLAIRTFRRTEKWKRAEFLAKEMKEFFDRRHVQNALLMIDWGSRTLPLLDPSTTNQGNVRVTREVQVHALLPHILKNRCAGSDAEASSDAVEAAQFGYTQTEAVIRDSYDTFLDGLERFSNYVEAELVGVPELRPYLQYWIDDIHSPAKDAEDAAWSAALLTYIQVYRFHGVQRLFRAFDRNIDPSGDAFEKFLSQMKDKVLAENFARVARAS